MYNLALPLPNPGRAHRFCQVCDHVSCSSICDLFPRAAPRRERVSASLVIYSRRQQLLTCAVCAPLCGQINHVRRKLCENCGAPKPSALRNAMTATSARSPAPPIRKPARQQQLHTLRHRAHMLSVQSTADEVPILSASQSFGAHPLSAQPQQQHLSAAAAHAPPPPPPPPPPPIMAEPLVTTRFGAGGLATMSTSSHGLGGAPSGGLFGHGGSQPFVGQRLGVGDRLLASGTSGWDSGAPGAGRYMAAQHMVSQQQQQPAQHHGGMLYAGYAGAAGGGDVYSTAGYERVRYEDQVGGRREEDRGVGGGAGAEPFVGGGRWTQGGGTGGGGGAAGTEDLDESRQDEGRFGID